MGSLKIAEICWSFKALSEIIRIFFNEKTAKNYSSWFLPEFHLISQEFNENPVKPNRKSDENPLQIY